MRGIELVVGVDRIKKGEIFGVDIMEIDVVCYDGEDKDEMDVFCMR